MPDGALLDRLCDDVLQTVFLPRAVVRQELSTWAVEPRYAADGMVFGAVLRREAELHFVLFRQVPLTRADVVAAVRPQLEQYGYVETRTPLHEARQRRFNEAIGFREVGRDALDVHYCMERDQCRLLR